MLRLSDVNRKKRPGVVDDVLKLFRKKGKVEPEAAEDPGQPFLFLELPRELRDEVYDYIIYPHLDDILVDPFSDHYPPMLAQAIFNINHQIRGEALYHLFRTKHLYFSTIETALHILNRVPEAKTDLKRLVLDIFLAYRIKDDRDSLETDITDQMDQLLGVLQELTGLRNLEIVIAACRYGLHWVPDLVRKLAKLLEEMKTRNPELVVYASVRNPYVPRRSWRVSIERYLEDPTLGWVKDQSNWV